MTLLQLVHTNVLLHGEMTHAVVQPISGMLSAQRYGKYVQDMKRLILPPDAHVSPGDRVEIEGEPLLCVSYRTFTDHVQADFRRCAR